jgi:hypothetical protein
MPESSGDHDLGGRVRPLACHAVRATSPPQVTGERPALQRSWSDPECPLDTVGDRCLWHVGGTAGENNKAPHWRRGLQLDSWVRRARDDECLVGKPRRRRGSSKVTSSL